MTENVPCLNTPSQCIYVSERTHMNSFVYDTHAWDTQINTILDNTVQVT
jgi:hypothetical protein